MDLQEIKTWLETNMDNEEVQNYIGGFVTVDRVKGYLDTDDGKKLLQPMLDKYHTKGLESWKQNNLESLIDAEVKKRFPEKDQKDIELEKIKAELAQIKGEKERETLTNKAIKIANDKKLPLDLVDFFISKDEETTVSNLNKLEEVMTNHIKTQVEERLKGSYNPPGDDGSMKTITLEQIKNMSAEEYQKNKEEIDKLIAKGQLK